MLPSRQTAVRLVGPDRVEFTAEKAVPAPGPTQILGRVECVGLCYSDMKLLHQFDRHPRKGPVVAGMAPEALRQIPSYVPEGAPTVPGHEAVLRVVAVGDQVRSLRPGDRRLVQADFRELPTATSNGAFGYNFEGALQEYVLLDERVVAPTRGEGYLLPVPDDRSASQLALVEPWACVEDAFAYPERSRPKPGGTVLLACAAGAEPDLDGLDLSATARRLALGAVVPPGFERVGAIEQLPPIDDLLVAGADVELVERLVARLALGGLALIARGPGRFARAARMPLGRIHYAGLRIVATATRRFADAAAIIPATSAIRAGDHVHVIGAGGPMGVMTVARALAGSRTGALVEGGVRNAVRAEALRSRIAPLAERRGVRLRVFDPERDRPEGPVDYAVVMAPVPELVARALTESAPRGIVNLFAGIPQGELHPLDLDALADKSIYLLGTSGSTVDDMRAVLRQVLAGELDTNLSVAAVSGMRGAIEGLTAVRDRTIAGKIIVYPQLHDLPLLELPALAARYPTVGAKLDRGCWTKAAEEELLKVAADCGG
jgi:threonine dehydrogenase-like Zn-dependent dehydrogenase